MYLQDKLFPAHMFSPLATKISPLYDVFISQLSAPGSESPTPRDAATLVQGEDWTSVLGADG